MLVLPSSARQRHMLGDQRGTTAVSGNGSAGEPQLNCSGRQRQVVFRHPLLEVLCRHHFARLLQRQPVKGRCRNSMSSPQVTSDPHSPTVTWLKREFFPYHNPSSSWRPTQKPDLEKSGLQSLKPTPLPIFPAPIAYSLPSDNAPATTTLPPACLLTPRARDPVLIRLLLKAARRSLLVEFPTLADH